MINWELFWTTESIAWFIIGTVLGVCLSVWINIKWGYLIRKWLRMYPKVDLYYYDITVGAFVKDFKSSENPLLRFTVIRDKATLTITFNFTDYLHKPTQTHIRLNKKFDFSFYSRFKNGDDYIKMYNAGKITDFLDEIFSKATNNWYKHNDVQFTSTLDDVKKVFPEITKQG